MTGHGSQVTGHSPAFIALSVMGLRSIQKSQVRRPLELLAGRRAKAQNEAQSLLPEGPRANPRLAWKPTKLPTTARVVTLSDVKILHNGAKVPRGIALMVGQFGRAGFGCWVLGVRTQVTGHRTNLLLRYGTDDSRSGNGLAVFAR